MNFFLTLIERAKLDLSSVYSMIAVQTFLCLLKQHRYYLTSLKSSSKKHLPLQCF